MEFVLESDNINDYLKSDKYIDFYDESIQRKANELFVSLSNKFDEKEKIKTTYEYVRDEIHHSGDIDSEKVTKTASEVLKCKEGMCVTKSLLLAALLRYGGIPTGLCYQRLTKGDTPDTGYVIHGLNAVYLSDEKKWVRLDARGNKKNVDAQFSIDEEKIAFPIRIEYGEVDYPIIYAIPHRLVMETNDKRKNRHDDPWELSEI
ncbi:MAG: transglutaminase family protein [Oscillospiraceae bacterium]|nr:transglutaminase family protein [Oscillospiraceae bacterium]